MAKIQTEARETCNIKSQVYKDMIKKVLDKEKAVLATIKQDNAGVEYKKLLLVEDMIYLASLYIILNNLCVDIIKTKNNDALNDARKSLYKAVIYLEEVVSPVVDAPFADYETRLSKIENVPVKKRYYIVRKLGLAIQLLKDAFGDNSKWKMSFVELQGRYAVVSKNLLDMKQAGKAYFDPNAPDYETIVMYARLLSKLLSNSATEFRDKYELASRRMDDMRQGINILSAQRRLLLIIGEKDEAEEAKKKATVWKEKLDIDQKKGRCN